MPTGQACLCQTWNQIEDFQRLAKLHKLEDKAFALLLAQGEGEKSDGKRVNYFPTWENARTYIRPFFVQPLVKAIPDMPVQKVHATNVPADASPLATFRVTVPKALLAKVSWEAIKNNPESLSLRFLVNKLFRPLMVGRKCRLEERGKLNLRSCFRDSFAVRSHQLMPSCN